MRKVNEMVKRIRLAVVHVCILGTLRSKMPYLWGKETTQAKLIENLQQVSLSLQIRAYIHHNTIVTYTTLLKKKNLQ